jgi:hypothetical protein
VETRQLLREKRLTRIGLRCPETLKSHLDRRAAARETTLSKHLLDLAVADLEKQRKSGRTLFDSAADMIRAAELARSGIESDAQRLRVLKRLTAFQMALLETA